MLFRGQAHEFLVRVHDSHVEGASGHVIAGPLDLHDVVADFRRVVATENRSVLLTFPLHFHSKGALGSSDADCQLSRAGAFRLANESALIRGENAVFYSGTRDSHFGRIRGAGYSENVGTAGNILTIVFNL